MSAKIDRTKIANTHEVQPYNLCTTFFPFQFICLVCVAYRVDQKIYICFFFSTSLNSKSLAKWIEFNIKKGVWKSVQATNQVQLNENKIPRDRKEKVRKFKHANHVLGKTPPDHAQNNKQKWIEFQFVWRECNGILIYYDDSKTKQDNKCTCFVYYQLDHYDARQIK